MNVLKSFQNIRGNMTLTSISSRNGFESTIRSANLVVIDFYATWCGPCKALAPKLDVLASKYSSVRFCKVDVDAMDMDEVANGYNVSAMPTIILFKNGKEVARVLGADITKIEAAVMKHK